MLETEKVGHVKGRLPIGDNVGDCVGRVGAAMGAADGLFETDATSVQVPHPDVEDDTRVPVIVE